MWNNWAPIKLKHVTRRNGKATYLIRIAAVCTRNGYPTVIKINAQFNTYVKHLDWNLATILKEFLKKRHGHFKYLFCDRRNK